MRKDALMIKFASWGAGSILGSASSPRALAAVLLVSLFFQLSSSVFATEFQTLIHAGKKITIRRVDLHSEHLRLFLRDDQARPIKAFTHLETLLSAKNERLVFGMNAGMYHGDFSPVGLCVVDGKELAPLNLANDQGNFFLKPNGVFCVTDRGASIVESSRFPGIVGKISLATQSGPMLVINGKLHPAFKDGSANRLYRNGVGVVSANEVVFAISEEPVNFHEFATFFRDAVHCDNALFLDGTISSLHAPELKRSDKKMDLGPIIGITEKR